MTVNEKDEAAAKVARYNKLNGELLKVMEAEARLCSGRQVQASIFERGGIATCASSRRP